MVKVEIKQQLLSCNQNCPIGLSAFAPELYTCIKVYIFYVFFSETARIHFTRFHMRPSVAVYRYKII